MFTYKYLKDLVDMGLPFQLPNFKIFHFKLPSKGPYQAIHFIWKENVMTIKYLITLNGLKLVTELKEKSQTFYSRSIKKEVKEKLLKPFMHNVVKWPNIL